MALFDVLKSDVQRLDTTIISQILVQDIPCDHCRQQIVFRIIRVGSVTEQFPVISNKARKLANLPSVITLRFDSTSISRLLQEEHIQVEGTCPHCSEKLKIDIFIT